MDKLSASIAVETCRWRHVLPPQIAAAQGRWAVLRRLSAAYDGGTMLKDLAAWLGVSASELSNQLRKFRAEQARNRQSPLERWLRDKGDLIALARPESEIGKHRLRTRQR